MTTQQPPPPHPRRPALRYNRELASQFGIDPDTPDPPRELVAVDSIPEPPVAAADAKAIRDGRRPDAPAELDVESAVVHVIAEEMDELAARLDRYGVAFPSPARQQMVDTALALLAGTIRTGGAIAGR